MRKQNLDEHIWFGRQEAQDLQKKAKKACLTEAALIRLLIRGYEPVSYTHLTLPTKLEV